MINIVFGAGHVDGAKIWMGYNEDANMLDLCHRKKAYIEAKYVDILAHVLKVTNIPGGYDAIQAFIESVNADYASFEHSNADDSINEEPNEPNRVVVYRTVKNPGDGPCRVIGQACADILFTTLAAIQHRAAVLTGRDYYGVLNRAMLAGCKDTWLTEHGFHTNASCRAKLSDPNVRQQLAEKEVDALALYMGWPKKEEDQVLQAGDKGPAVVAWQNWLIAWNPAALPKYGADGDFGGETVTWTNQFKVAVAMIADGIVDDLTWSAMTDTIDKQNDAAIAQLQASLEQEKAKTNAALAANAILMEANDGLKVQVNLQTEEMADAALDIRNLLDFSNKH